MTLPLDEPSSRGTRGVLARCVRSERLWFWFVSSALSIAAAGIAFGHRFLPLVDWPQACLQASILRHYDEPAWAFSQYYRIRSWFVPYQGFRYLQVLLSEAFGDDVGMRAALLVYLVGLPLSFMALAKRCGVDRWASLGVFTILVEANFLWGFASHVAATTLLICSTVMTAEFTRTASRRLALAHALLGVGLFFTHPIVTCVWCATSAAVVCVAWRDRRISLGDVLVFAASVLPGAILLAVFLLIRGWIDGSALQDAGNSAHISGVEWASPLESLTSIGEVSGLAALGPVAIASAVTALLAAQVLHAASPRGTQAPDEWRPKTAWVLFWVFVCLWLCLPERARGERIASRLASLVVLSSFLVPLIRARIRSAASVWLARGMLVVCAAMALANVHARFSVAGTELAALDRIFAIVPRGSRVASVAYSRASSALDMEPYEHVGALVTARRGGLTSFMFTRLGIEYAPTVPTEKLMLRPPNRPTVSRLKRGWLMPAPIANYYDYVLVRVSPGYRGRPFKRAKVDAKRVFRSETYELWKVNGRRLELGHAK